MRKFRKSLNIESTGQFGEMPDKMLICNQFYDKTTLTLLKNKSSDKYNQYDYGNPGFYAVKEKLNTYIFHSGSFQKSFEGIGGFADTWSGFSVNCCWQESNNKPIYEFETEHYFYRYTQEYDRTSRYAGFMCIFKNTGSVKTAYNANNLGSQSLTIQSDLNKNKLYMGAPYSNGYTYMYELTLNNGSIDTINDMYYSSNAIGACNTLINDEQKIITSWRDYSSPNLKIAQYDKGNNAHTYFSYKHPDSNYVSNTSGYLPIKLKSDNSITNCPNYHNYIYMFYSDCINNTSELRQYYMCSVITPANNDQAPFIETYVDADGNTQEVDMNNGIRSNGDRYALFFTLHRLNVNIKNKEYYHDIIDIDWSSYPDANMWDTTDTAARYESYNKNVHFDKHESHESIYCDCEWVTIGTDNYLIAIINQSTYDGVKCVFCAFTLNDNTATLINEPLIIHELDDNSNKFYNCKKIDNTGMNWHLLEMNTSNKSENKVYQINWTPTDNWIKIDLSAKWNKYGFYIDDFNRAWGIDIDKVLYVGNLYDEWIIYTDIDINPKIKLYNNNPTVTTVNAHITNKQGIDANAVSFNVVIDAPLNNATFDDGATTITITTDSVGIATFNLTVFSEGNFNFHIDPL